MSLIGPDDLTALIRAATIAIGESDPADPFSLREVLWLAAVVGPDGNAGQERPSCVLSGSALAGRGPQPELHPGKEQSVGKPAAQPQGTPQHTTKLFDASDQVPGGQAGGVRARPVNLAGPTGLRGKLKLARALRPFRRSAPSRHQRVLDVEATIRASAVTRQTLPVLRPAAERRFSADLVFDSSPSMTVWDDTFDEIALIFQHVGAFREVTKWLLHTNQRHDEIWLTDRNGYRRPPAMLRSADRRRIVLVMTDGVGGHWYTPAIWACLADWGTSGPTALIDPLPLKLWNLSGIGPDRVRVRASSAGVANVDLRYKVPRITARRPAARTVPIPVTEFSPAALAAWGATVADAHPDGCVAVLTPPESPLTTDTSRTDDADSEASLSNFILTASPTALRLAVLAAVSPSTTLAVLRAIQDELLPDSSTSDLAEVLVSGIYRQLPSRDAEAGLRIRMDPGCRAQLQKRASAQDRWDVYRAISATLARHYLGSARSFQAAVQDPLGHLHIPAAQQPFAEMARSALAQARLGSRPAVLFLSYVEEDGEAAREITRLLEANAFEVFRWENPRRRGWGFIRQIEDAIQRSDAFLALLSPSFLASDWCRRERDIAIRREQYLQRSDPGRLFIHVLQIVPTQDSAAGFLGNYDWLDLTSPGNREESLDELARQLQAISRRPLGSDRMDPSGQLRITAGQQAFPAVALDALAEARLSSRPAMFFLSYAEEDRETAGQVARWLEDNRFEVFRWEDPRRRGRKFIRQIEEAIQRSDAFLVLLSPSFLASDWCRRQGDIAIRREQYLQRTDPSRRLVHVLQVTPTPVPDAGFLGNYDWLDLTSPGERMEVLSELAGRLQPEAESTASAPGQPGGRKRGEPQAGVPEPVGFDPVAPAFRGREGELSKILRGLIDPVGPHFWLVVAPPQLGKTWFVRRVSALVGPVGWVVSLVDLRDHAARVRSSATAVLGLLAGIEPLEAIGPDTLLHIAREIARSRKPHLWALDSAELMERQAAAALRSYVSQVYHLVRENASINVRLGLIIAGRRDNEWRGVTPAPRVSQLPLTEFSTDVVEQMLRDLAQEMDRTNFSDAFYAENSARIHRLTEGLPALLVRCLDWIRDQEWFGMAQLESQELFEELTGPYVQDDLLARQSLFPGGRVQGDEPLQALVHVFRVLVRYRLFTMSHLRHHFETDPSFSECLTGQQWSLEYLLKAIGGTALLSRPLNEPWQEIHPAIRRLLYRHYYSSREERAEAHTEARKFVEAWTGQQPGIEQVVGLVECLWHEATILRLREWPEMERRLSESARKLSRALQPSTVLTVSELREYATDRLTNDEELQETISVVDGLFTRLVEIVATPM